MAATLFFPPPTIPIANPYHLPQHIEDVEEAIIEDIMGHHLLGQAEEEDTNQDSEELLEEGEPSHSPEASPDTEVVIEEEDGEEVEEADDEDEDHQNDHQRVSNPEQPSGVDISRRVTLIPRRTLSLSPTSARAGDMMARNLRAARWLDFTNEDDDDGLYQPSDSDSEAKRKTMKEEMSVSRAVRVTTTRRGGSLGSLTLGAAMTGLSTREVFSSSRRGTPGMKRPLEVTLPCQEIQYLDISYQKVGIHSVQFSPIPRKKIAYHPVPYHSIHYCDVPYLGERPVKRKPPA